MKGSFEGPFRHKEQDKAAVDLKQGPDGTWKMPGAPEPPKAEPKQNTESLGLKQKIAAEIELHLKSSDGQRELRSIKALADRFEEKRALIVAQPPSPAKSRTIGLIENDAEQINRHRETIRGHFLRHQGVSTVGIFDEALDEVLAGSGVPSKKDLADRLGQLSAGD